MSYNFVLATISLFQVPLKSDATIQVHGNQFDMISVAQLVQGVLGIKVKIMLDWDPRGKQDPTTPLPDLVTIHAPKEERGIDSAVSDGPGNIICFPKTRVLEFQPLLQGDELHF